MLTFAAGMPVAGRYLLVERLHAGPATQLWTAFDDVLGRAVAVKFFPQAAGDERARCRLHARARTAARLSHPHLAAVLDFGDVTLTPDRQVPYVVSALIEGVTLTARIASGPISGPTTAQVTGEIAEALAAMHERGVTHGELTSDSVLVTSAGAMLLGVVGSGWARCDHAIATAADDVRDLAGLALHATAAVPLDAEESEQRRAAAQAGLSRTLTSLLLSCLAEDPRQRPDATAVARGCGVVQARHTVGVPSGAHPVLNIRRHRARAQRIGLPLGLVAMSTLGLVMLSNLTGVGHGFVPQIIPAAIAGSQAAGPSGSVTSSKGQLTASPRITPVPRPTASSPSPRKSPRPPVHSEESRHVAVEKFRDRVRQGRVKGEIVSAVAQELLAAADELAESSMSIERRVLVLAKRVSALEKADKIERERAELLRAALADILPEGRESRED